MISNLITVEELEKAIEGEKLAREQSIAQANFHAGYQKALEDVKARMEETKDEVPEAASKKVM